MEAEEVVVVMVQVVQAAEVREWQGRTVVERAGGAMEVEERTVATMEEVVTAAERSWVSLEEAGRMAEMAVVGSVELA